MTGIGHLILLVLTGFKCEALGSTDSVNMSVNNSWRRRAIAQICDHSDSNLEFLDLRVRAYRQLVRWSR